MGIVKKGLNLYRIDAHVFRSGTNYRRRELYTGTKAQAEERYLQLKKELREGGSIACSLTQSELRTFGDLLKIYQGKRIQCSKSHLNKIRFIERELGAIDLPFFTDRFERYLEILKTTYPMVNWKTKRISDNPRSNACINRLVEIVRAAFNMGVALDILKTNPISKVRFPRLKELPRDVVLNQVDVQRLLNTVGVEAPHLGAIVRFALQVPCRKSELVNMKRDDLDLIHNAIRVKAGNSKNDIPCWKPIPPDMVGYFRTLPNEAEYLFYRTEDDKKTGTTKYFGLGNFQRSWRRCLKLAGLSFFHFHDTRHISATALIDNGTPEQAVMSVANWKTNMLRSYYHREPKQALQLVRFTPYMECPKSVQDVSKSVQV